MLMKTYVVTVFFSWTLFIWMHCLWWRTLKIKMLEDPDTSFFQLFLQQSVTAADDHFGSFFFESWTDVYAFVSSKVCLAISIAFCSAKIEAEVAIESCRWCLAWNFRFEEEFLVELFSYGLIPFVTGSEMSMFQILRWLILTVVTCRFVRRIWQNRWSIGVMALMLEQWWRYYWIVDGLERYAFRHLPIRIHGRRDDWATVTFASL